MSNPPARPTIPVGDVVRQFKLPGWLRALLNFFRGTKVRVGPVDIELDQKQGATLPGTGLDQPHRVGPQQSWGPRR